MSTEVADAVFSDFRQHRTTDLAMLFSALRMVSIADQLNSIRVPVRIIGGTNDPVIPFRETRNLADTIPNADLQPLPGIGHLFYAEDNQHVQHLLLDWIRQHSPST